MAETLTRDVALALLGNTLPTGAILVVLITIFGPISGAHFNPAVTLWFALQGQTSSWQALAYVPVQFIAAIIGVWLAHAMFGMPLLEVSHKLREGPPQWLAEFVATFGLVMVVRLCARQPLPAIATAVAAYIGAAYWFTASTSFANPAVTLGRAFSDTYTGIRIADVPAFVAPGGAIDTGSSSGQR